MTDLDARIAAYRAAVIDALAGDVEAAYVAGDLFAQRRIHRARRRTITNARNPKGVATIDAPPFRLRFGEVSKEALAYLDTYTNDLAHGGTWIKGEFVRWLDNHCAEVRDDIATVITDGVREGWGQDVVTRALADVVEGERWKLERIARTETMRIQRHGMIQRYGSAGVQKVRRLLGANPCPECAAERNAEYPIDEVPEDHVQGFCDWVPLVTVEPYASALMPPDEVDRLLEAEV